MLLLLPRMGAIVVGWRNEYKVESVINKLQVQVESYNRHINFDFFSPQIQNLQLTLKMCFFITVFYLKSWSDSISSSMKWKFNITNVESLSHVKLELPVSWKENIWLSCDVPSGASDGSISIVSMSSSTNNKNGRFYIKVKSNSFYD
jgi:hypothetical protein